jgi:hypothetical protein
MIEKITDNFIELIDEAIESDTEYQFYRESDQRAELENGDYWCFDSYRLESSTKSDQEIWSPQDYRYIAIDLNKLKHYKRFTDEKIRDQLLTFMKVCPYLKMTGEDSLSYENYIKTTKSPEDGIEVTLEDINLPQATATMQPKVGICIGLGYQRWRKAWLKGNTEALSGDFLIVYLDTLLNIQNNLDQKISISNLNSVTIKRTMFSNDLKKEIIADTNVYEVRLEVLTNLKDRKIISGFKETSQGSFQIKGIKSNLLKTKIDQVGQRYRDVTKIVAELVLDNNKTIYIKTSDGCMYKLHQLDTSGDRGSFFMYMYDHSEQEVYNDKFKSKNEDESIVKGLIATSAWVSQLGFKDILLKLFWGSTSQSGPNKLKLKIKEQDLLDRNIKLEALEARLKQLPLLS